MRAYSAYGGTAHKALQFAAAALVAALLGACAAGGGLPGTDGATTAGEPVSIDENGEFVTRSVTVLDKVSPVRVGLILPLSGNDRGAAVAKTMRQAGELALFELDNPAVQLIVKDTKGTPEGAKAAAEAALRAGAEIIIGPLYAQSVSAVKPVAKARGVPVIAFSSDSKVAGDGVYLLSFIAGREVPRIISYALSQGKRGFAALIPDDAYGRLVAARFRREVARGGGSIIAMETYPRTANGMLKPAKRIKEAIDQAGHDGAPVDALFMPADQDTLPMIGALMPYAEIDTASIKLLGTGGWDFPNAGREKSLVGGWYPSPDPRGWQDFAQRFVKANGAMPPRIASLAHDAVSIAITLSSAPKGARYTHARLSRPGGFSGIDGSFRFSRQGMPERGLAILEVRKFDANVLDAAPYVFGTRRAGSTATGSLGTAAAAGIAKSGSSWFNLNGD